MTPNPNDNPSPDFAAETPPTVVPHNDVPQTVARTTARSAQETAATTTEIAAAPILSDWQVADDAAYDSFDAAPPLNLDASLGTAEMDTAERDLSGAEAASGFEAAEQFEEDTRDKELDLMAHLGELRSRLLKSVGATFVCMLLTWQFRDQLLEFFSHPIAVQIKQAGGKLVTSSPAEGFSLYLQITLAAAIILAIPVIIYQAWAFIEPALTHKERRYGMTLVPFSILLFFSGAALGFYLTPLFFRFFLQFQPPNSESYWSYASVASLLAKMLLVFGICFQVPVVTVFLNKIGLMSRNWMIEYWRHVVVVMFTVVAIITPTWDPVTLTAAALPPCILYGASIWLVKWL